ncbi:glycosyltransferase family 4 protein [Cyclobacterium amurskyense]|uniref:glycosyltransferase family 4 protein n=1 Tax=Cyclobacterium amurskyense TaxID=320787 RepID=UPI0030DD84D6|tara:strand:+ start:11332 stop:12522 length:1191 start_codon:yes stop_codon:yes gene_type:complete
MKRILYLTFYFKPDLCAGSFRNSPLLEELANQGKSKNIEIDVFTTLPNRYSSFSQEALEVEVNGNVKVERIAIPTHNSGIKDQSISFKTYFDEVKSRIKGQHYDLVFASSSRLFTAYLGYTIAKKRNIPLYLDIRDIFVDTINDVLKSAVIKTGAIPVLKFIEKKTFGYAKHINLISAGFKPYFSTYKKATYSYFSNGIDQVFIDENKRVTQSEGKSEKKRIVYAGNIGEGQGLHKVVPQAAKQLSQSHKFHIIGDGGAKQLLIDQIEEEKVSNVILRDPMGRNDLIQEYHNADYLLIHLNDYEAFKKVLPSKIFELAMFNKPLLAGVNGYAREFIQDNLGDSLLFFPGGALELVEKLNKYESEEHDPVDRSDFIRKFNRDAINEKMATSILDLLN